MKNIEELLHVLKVIGKPIYEQQKKLVADKLYVQERFVIDMPSVLNELDVASISNFCKTFGFRCEIISVSEGVHEHLQVQFFKLQK